MSDTQQMELSLNVINAEAKFDLRRAGWNPWHGRTWFPPTEEHNDLVDVKLRDGRVNRGMFAKNLVWRNLGTESAWHIVAWRYYEPKGVLSDERE